LNVDGNTAAWYRISVQMNSGVVSLKVDSTKIEYFSSGLEAWVHYVPIKDDFSDLIEKIQWLKKNDDKAKEIAKNGQAFARFHFQKSQI
jgi:hypothetical protein